jgi:hypothetical protein
VRGLLASILRRGIKEGVFRRDLDPDLDADIVYRTVMALSELGAGAEEGGRLSGQIELAVLGMVGFHS